jgi:hypothetical protein
LHKRLHTVKPRSKQNNKQNFTMTTAKYHHLE